MDSICQFVLDPETGAYRPVGRWGIADAPSDADWRRWSMLYDGEHYRLYCFKGSTRDTLYQFAWDDDVYRFGYASDPELKLVNVPADADLGSFSMSHSGNDYRLFVRRLGAPGHLYQLLWTPDTNEYRYGRGDMAPQLEVVGFPADTDWSRWSTFHDGEDFFLFACSLGSKTDLYRGAWNGRAIEYGHPLEQTLSIEGASDDINIASMAMLFDDEFCLYLQSLDGGGGAAEALSGFGNLPDGEGDEED